MSTERFLVSARKYRPQTFSELVSQQHVSETLRNALRYDRLAHAYLFSGPRGVGKTSAARILAKAVNCTTPYVERPDLDPCRQCESCKSFETGRSLAVIEIDAASNNSVDDVRALRDTVRIPPQDGKKKVYIIDEVHMLSKQAFNALLKTLEEPPSYVQFIFATTEPHKVIPTILSRCQRFDFRRISVPEIVEKLREICTSEGIEADDDSLRLIARKGDGALRDAFSTFDQAVLLCGKKLDYPVLAEALGAVDVDVFFKVTDHAVSRDRAGMLRLVEDLMRKGYDLREFLIGLSDHIRNLIVAVTTNSVDLIESDEATRKRYLDQTERLTEADLLRQLVVVAEAEDGLRFSSQPRLRVELALLKLASMENAKDLSLLLQKLDSLGSDHTIGAPPSDRSPSRPDTPRRSETKPAEPSPPATTRSTPVAETERLHGGRSGDTHATRNVARSMFGKPALDASTSRTEKQEPDTDNGPGVIDLALESGSGSGSGIFKHVTIDALEAAWKPYVHRVMNERIHVGALLQHAQPTEVRAGVVEIGVPDTFHERLLGGEMEYLRTLLADVLEIENLPTPKLQVVDELNPADPAVELNEISALDHMKKLQEENPVIRSLLDRFGGELIW